MAPWAVLAALCTFWLAVACAKQPRWWKVPAFFAGWLLAILIGLAFMFLALWANQVPLESGMGPIAATQLVLFPLIFAIAAWRSRRSS